MAIPITLTIAGSDSGGGAGIQADIKTLSALGTYATSVITALTAQNTCEVRAIQDVPTKFIAEQIDCVCDDIKIDAVKIGMLGTPQVIRAVRQGLDRHGLNNVVLDPVMVAKSGDKLLADEAVDALRTELLARATIVTPNLPEAAVLLNESVVSSAEQMATQGERVLQLGAQAVLMKGGHAEGPQNTDVLLTPDTQSHYSHPHINTTNTHGTGCTLSSAIAAQLAHGHDLEAAVKLATDYIHEAIKAADTLNVGKGHGPVHHFHALWKTEGISK